MEYTVMWTIEIDALSTEEAAMKALNIQRDPQSIATHFVVICKDGDKREIDLGEPIA